MPRRGPRPHTWVFPHDKIKTAAYQKYLISKNQAGFRSEPWGLTFDQWWQLWEDSGHWQDRGKGSKSWCMIQQDTSLGWIPGNCTIVLRSDSLKTQRDRLREPQTKISADLMYSNVKYCLGGKRRDESL
jgi:hypothetical protein